MLLPSFGFLEKLVLMEIRGLSNASGMHPDPRLYKYAWRVFWRGSPVDGRAFFDTPALSTKAALELAAALDQRGEPYVIYNRRMHRRGVTLWNLKHPRFAKVTFAPAYDDDPDPSMASGHR